MPALPSPALITANGTYTVATFAGKKYTFAAAGNFGGGTLAILWRDAAGNTGSYAQSPATAAENWTATAATVQVDLVLTGATSPAITITFAPAEGKGLDGDSVGALYVTGELTVAGNLAVDTNTLFVDAANNRVGVGTSSPEYALDIRPVGFAVNQAGGIRFNNTSGSPTWGSGLTLRSDSGGNAYLSIDGPNYKDGIMTFRQDNTIRTGPGAVLTFDSNTGSWNGATLTTTAGVVQSPPATATPAANGQMLFEATSNTSLTVKLRGTDGVVRSIILTLAP